ncbi:MAG: PAS domain S-box protein [Actinobacteria bacterium]|nr:PAS domain S-box protein [Actinomycetota bacterium]
MSAEDIIKDYQDILRQYNILNQISKTVASTLDLNKILKIILTGVTLGDGFGFNRAFLFLIDRHSKNLKGRMAIGPSSADDAWKVWSEIQDKNYSLEEFLDSERFENEQQLSFLDEKIRNISIPVDINMVIWKCLEDGIPRNIDISSTVPGGENEATINSVKEIEPAVLFGEVKAPAQDNLIQVININDAALIDAELAEYMDYPKFCIIPLISRTKKVGILIVDNKYNQREITPDDIKFLLLLGQFAASSIRNTIIYNDLKDSISALSKLNMKLNYLKDYNEKIIESIPVSIIVVDHNFTVTQCNENCGKLIGFEKETFIGKQINAHEIFIDGVSLIDEIFKVIRENKAEGFYKVNMKINGEKTDEIFDIILVPFRFSEESPEGAVIIIENVTNTVRLETELGNAKKLSQLGKLSATVAHEIRNPLIAIGGYAARVKRKFLEGEQTDIGNLEIIIEEVKRLERIVNEILDFAASREIKFSHVNISNLLLECINFAKAAAEQNNIDIVFECGSELVENANLHVFGSRDHLKQALLNILNNAIDASSKRDKIRICITTDGKDSYYDFPGSGHGGQESFSSIFSGCRTEGEPECIIIYVNNSASLSNREDIKNIFLPFYTTKTKGTGLGLTITKKIIEQHSGAIEVCSSIENGTTFAIKLPLLDI